MDIVFAKKFCPAIMSAGGNSPTSVPYLLFSAAVHPTKSKLIIIKKLSNVFFINRFLVIYVLVGYDTNRKQNKEKK